MRNRGKRGIIEKNKGYKMEEDYSSNGLLDIVRGLQDIEANPNGPTISEERQGGENIRLTGDGENGPENW